MLTGTTHFTLAEVARNTQWPIPAEYQDNAQATLEELEEVRAVLGVPLRLTSLWRSGASNAGLPGSAKASQHLVANGADFLPVGISLEEAGRRWQTALDNGYVPDFHQFIVEEAGDDGLGAHIHYGRGTGNQTLVRLADGTYQQLVDWLTGFGNAIVAGVEDVATVVTSGGAALWGWALALGFRGLPRRIGPTWAETLACNSC